MTYYSTYLRLNLHVGATSREVLRAAQRKLKPEFRYDRFWRDQRHAFYREMLQHHHAAQNLYRAVLALSGEERNEFVALLGAAGYPLAGTPAKALELAQRPLTIADLGL